MGDALGTAVSFQILTMFYCILSSVCNVCVHAKVNMWKSEDNLLESIHTWDPGIKLRP